MNETIEHKKMKAGMKYSECLAAIADGNVGVIHLLPNLGEVASEIMGNNRPMYGVLSIFDVMGIYGSDIASLFSRLCEKDPLKLLKIIWSYEVGLNLMQLQKTVPEYAKLESIKQIIKDLDNGTDVSFPFEEAKIFIEKNSLIRF